MNRTLLMSTNIGLAVALGGASPPPMAIPAIHPANTKFSAVPARAASRAPVANMPRRVPRHPPHVVKQPLPAAVRHVIAANRDATREPAAQGFTDAAQLYPYAEGALYHVYAAPGRVTDIALQPGETLGSVASGDTARWVIGDASSGSADSRRTHVLLKPFSAGLSTSLVITTDRRIYHVTLTSTAGPAMAMLSWTYPQDDLIALKHAAEKAEGAIPVATGVDVEQLHFNYAVSGDAPGWRPLRAFDDGRQTFIEFPASLATGEAPPLFVVGAKGDAQLVNYRVRGRYYVVDRLFDVAELRLGLKHQQVVRISRTGNVPASRRGA